MKLIIKYILFICLLIIYSCSNSASIRKSKSSFLAYYNTFYAAEKSYNDAAEIIALDQTNNDEIPSSAISLLEEAIENALIIEQQFYNTKYLDDAYFILGKSSYLIDRITAANYYFTKLCEEFPQSNFYDESNIWMGYIDLKIGNVEKAKNKLSLLSSISEKNKFLLYLLGANISKFEVNIEDEKKYYLLAVQYAVRDFEKINIYNKLLNISEELNEISDCIQYINEIEKLISYDTINKELIQKWIDYSILEHQYDLVIHRLEDLISNTIKTSEINEYNIQKAEVYILSGEYSKAQEILDLLISNNNESMSSKNLLSHAYYLLGEIEFKFYYNYEKAEENFENSIESSSNSEYGKKSEKYIELILDYKNTLEEIDYTNSMTGFENPENSGDNEFMIPLPDDFKTNNLDSLSYHLAYLLYFDLNSVDSSLVKFKQIVNKFPESNFALKSLIILDIEEPLSNWDEIIETNFPNSVYSSNVMSDPMESRRNQAWDLLSESYEVSIDMFLSLHKEFEDEKSLYSAGYISDYIYNDISNSIDYYNMYLSNYEEGQYYPTIQSRLSEIKDMLVSESDNLEQSINYKKAWFWINDNINVDSSLYYLEKSISSGKNFSLKSYSESLKSSLEDYAENKQAYDTIISDNPDGVNIDSIKINLAHFLFKEVNFDEQALNYYKEIINNNSTPNYVNSSLASLIYLEPENNWDSLLFANVNQDSSIYNSIILSSLKKEPFKSIGTIASDSLDFLWYNSLYNDFFKSEEIDTTQIIEEPIENNEDINNDAKANQ